MPLSLEVADAFVIVPNPEDAVLPPRNEVLALSRDIERVELVL